MITQKIVSVVGGDPPAVFTNATIFVVFNQGTDHVWVGDENVSDTSGFLITAGKGYSFQYPQTQPATQRYVCSLLDGEILVYEDTPYSTDTPVPVPMPIQFSIS
jgi:hypothetical protein